MGAVASFSCCVNEPDNKPCPRDESSPEAEDASTQKQNHIASVPSDTELNEHSHAADNNGDAADSVHVASTTGAEHEMALPSDHEPNPEREADGLLAEVVGDITGDVATEAVHEEAVERTTIGLRLDEDADERSKHGQNGHAPSPDSNMNEAAPSQSETADTADTELTEQREHFGSMTMHGMGQTLEGIDRSHARATSSAVPANIGGQNAMRSALDDPALQALSVQLVTAYNGKFIKFVEKLLKSKLKDKIWSKCDSMGEGRIDGEKFMYFWILPVTLFKVARHQKQTKTKGRPKLDDKAMRREVRHLAVWIIRRYGVRQEDGSYSFILEREGFDKKIMKYLKEYAATKGAVAEEEDF